MVDLMDEDWGNDPLAYYHAADIDDRLEFARTWSDNASGHFAKFRGMGSTQQLMELLRTIADDRTSYWANPGGPYQSHSHVDAALYADTLDVVKTSTFHCGGWLGLLTIINDPDRRASSVHRYDQSGPLRFITWPPTSDTSLLGILSWLMQAITIAPLNMASGNSWSANQQMQYFVKGQYQSGGGFSSNVAQAGYESFADTVLGMVYMHADKQLLHFYLRALRGHGPTEPGNRAAALHYLNAAASSTDADGVDIRENFELGMNRILMAFPAIFGATTVADFEGSVTGHFRHWRVGTGNHRTGLTWLRDAVQRRIATWNADTILAHVNGARVIQRTYTTAVSQALERTRTTMTQVSASIEQAAREQTSEAWIRELSSSITNIESMSETSGTSFSNETEGEFGNETAITVGGETGALEEFLIGKLTGEVTNTTQWRLRNQFTAHRNNEETTSETEQTTQAETNRTERTRLREQSLSMTRASMQRVTELVREALTISQNLTSIEAVDDDNVQQVARVRAGLAQALTSINTAISSL